VQIGIVGLPYSGKSTLFQTITKTLLDPSSMGRGETHQAIVKVPDARLQKLAEIFHTRSVVNATIEFVDVVGLKKGESGSTQFSTNFLASVKNNDTLVEVVRLFANDAVPHPDGSVDALRDIATFETEFILSDMAAIETRLDKIKRQIQKTGDEIAKKEQPVLEKCLAQLQQEKPLRDMEFTKEELFVMKTYQFLTLKPLLIALNGDESQLTSIDSIVEKIKATRQGKATKIVSFFGQIEMEMSELSDDDAKMFMGEYGITESALTTLIREAFDLLGLQAFFTAGEDECRAWTIRKGATAQEAAGAIHSDFVKTFIRAEVVPYKDYIAANGSMAKAKEAGAWRLEGKEYIVQEADVMEIRHS